MTPEGIITICVIIGAIILFVTELLTIDLVALMIIFTLVVFGVITPEEGVSGFSNSATLTVAFMFVISAAVLKTGALQHLAVRLSKIFREHFTVGMLLMMLLVAVISAFVNNTPVVAVFIPVIIKIANASGKSPALMLIPLSFASILGGMCTLIGTSTNILVDGILQKEGKEGFHMFEFSSIGIIFLGVGIIYMIFLGIKLLPKRQKKNNLTDRYDVKDYISEIKIEKGNSSIGKRIMDSDWVKEFSMDIIEIRRKNGNFLLPQGDFILQENDVLKVQCNFNKIRDLKDIEKVNSNSTLKISREHLKSTETTLVEIVITSNSSFEGKTLRDIDFRRTFRAVPLALKHREEIIQQKLYETTLKSGDVVLAEVKNHYLDTLKKIESQQGTPFVLLSEATFLDFNPRKFGLVMSIVLSVIVLASFNILPIMIAALLGMILMVFTKVIDMKEAYKAINWQIVFLLAGALSLGTAMKNAELDVFLANGMTGYLKSFGPIAILSGLYLCTSLLTEIMSNNATAALMTPIALAISESLGLNYMPFVIAVMFSASASFMTPIGYQTNAMVFSAGQYKFTDFIKVGIGLNLLFWILATFLIPIFFPFY